MIDWCHIPRFYNKIFQKENVSLLRISNSGTNNVYLLQNYTKIYNVLFIFLIPLMVNIPANISRMIFIILP